MREGGPSPELQQEDLRTRLKELPALKELVPGSDFESYRLPTRFWLESRAGKMTQDDLARVVEKESARARVDVRDPWELEEEALGIEGPNEGKILSEHFVNRAEQLEGTEQEAFIRGYGDYRKGGDALKFLMKIVEGEVDSKKVPPEAAALAEGMARRDLEDQSIWGRTIEQDYKRISELSEKLGVDLFTRFRDAIERFLEQEEQGHSRDNYQTREWFLSELRKRLG